MSDLQILSKERLVLRAMEQRQGKPRPTFAKGVNLRELMRDNLDPNPRKRVLEFVGNGDFGAAFNTRQRYEIDLGLDSEPILYTPVYNIVRDRGLPRNVSINRLGPGGVVFKQVVEGGEVQMASLGSSTQSVPMVDWATGIEYSMQVVMDNETWNLAPFENQAGVAHNALLNDIHLGPIIAYTYTAANQTAASALGATLDEKTLHTFEDASANAALDTSNRRRGPYVILCSVANLYRIERALSGNVVGGGVDLSSSLRAKIRAVIAYDGWEGIQAGVSTTYAGVTAGKAYLIDVNPAVQLAGARSFERFLMDRLEGNEDISRLMAAQTVLWSSLGTYINVPAISEEVTLPTS